MLWREVKTPAALVALDKLEANTARMSEHVGRLGARLRPHVKTHKCVEAARFQVRGHFGGITVSTLAEARYFARSGFRDVTYAVPIAPARLDEAIELTRELDELNLLLDHVATLEAMERAARASGVVLRAFLKVDCGYHRAGVDPESDDSVRLALKMKTSPYVAFRGILTHAGHAYHAKNPPEIREIGHQERRVMVRFAEKLVAAGVPVTDVSVGSTPTMSLAESLDGVTEARPGNYAFYDRFQATIGSCSLDDAAFSVLVTVIGHYPSQNQLLVDAGALAFSKDEGPTHVDPDCGFGAIFSVPEGRLYASLRLQSLSQEHGKIGSSEPVPFDALPVGTKLRIVPNHSCLAAALFESYHVTRGADVVEQWRPVRGW